MKNRTCRGCGENFIPRAKAKHCSHECRRKGYLGESLGLFLGLPVGLGSRLLPNKRCWTVSIDCFTRGKIMQRTVLARRSAYKAARPRRLAA